MSRPLDLALVGLIGSAALVIVALGWRKEPARTARGRLTAIVEPRLGSAGALLLLAVLFAPTTIMDSWGADLRIAPMAVSLALLAIRPLADPRVEASLALTGLVLFGVRASAVASAWSGAADLRMAQLALLDRLPVGGRVGYLEVATSCGTRWRIGPDRHLGSYAVTRRGAFTNTSFVVRGADLVTVRAPADAARWVDGSQAVRTVRCPAGTPEPEALPAALARMRPSFPAIWIVGEGGKLPPVAAQPGWRVLGRAPGSLLLARG